MKKIMALAMAALMLLSVLVMSGCNTTPDEPELPDVPALEALTAIWNQWPEDMRFYSYGGAIGSETHPPVENAPAAFDISDADVVSSTLGLPAELVASVDGAANLVHGMNANTFTAASFHFTAGADKAAITSSLVEALQTKIWMCGFPEKVIVLSIGANTIVYAYGAGELVDTFAAQAQAAYPDAVVLADAPVAM